MLFGEDMPSYTEWLRQQNAKLDADGVPPSAVQRAHLIAARTPLAYLHATAYRAAYAGARNYLRSQHRKAIDADNGTLYLKAEQMELSQLEGFLMANSDRRMADAKSERKFVTLWCEVHQDAGLTPADIYGQLQIPVPVDADE